MKLKSEPFLLILIFGMLLFLGFNGLFDHKLTHEFPQGFQANDAFYKYNRASYLIETGSFEHPELYTVDERTDLFQRDNPLAAFLTAVYSLNGNIPGYDSWQFLGIIIKIFSVFVVYLIIRKINPKVALASLGLAPFIFIKNNMISFHFGWIPITIAMTLIIFIIWSILNFELSAAWLIFGLGISAVLLTHLPEFYYGVLISIVLFGYLLIKTKDLKIIKKVLFGTVIFLLLTAYFLPLMIYTSLSLSKDESVTAIGVFQEPTFPITVFNDLGIFGYLVIFGILFSIYYCYKHKEKIIYFIPFYVLIIISNLTLFGMHDRFYQVRYFWPVIFMIFFGLGIYFMLEIIFKLKSAQMVNDYWKNICFGIVVVGLIILSGYIYYTPTTSQGLVANQEMWAGMQWVKNELPQNHSILIVHGDNYQQVGTFLMFGKVIHQIKDEDYFAKLNTGQITGTYMIRKFVHGYDYLTRTGFFTFEPVKLGKPEWEETRGWEERDLCEFDYYVIDKPSQIPQVTAYNLKIRETLLKNGNFKEVFSNGWYSILQNNNPGGDCLGK